MLFTIKGFGTTNFPVQLATPFFTNPNVVLPRMINIIGEIKGTTDICVTNIGHHWFR